MLKSFVAIIILSLFMILSLSVKLNAAQSISGWQSDGEGVIIINGISTAIIYAHNAEVKMAPASLTKLMTALLVVNKDKLTDIVTLGTEVQGVEGSVIGLKPGDRITVENLLYALLVHSGNDTANALAVHTDGSLPKFVAEMNNKCKQMGLASTNFVNPHGLPAPNHYSTAHDISQIAQIAMSNPIIRKIVATREHTITWQKANGKTYSMLLRNTNSFLGVYPGVIGVKTGTTTEAGQCLVTDAQWGSANVIIVVLKSQNRFKDTLHYLDLTYEDLVLKEAQFNILRQRGLNN